jgi:hypothetical protein
VGRRERAVLELLYGATLSAEEVSNLSCKRMNYRETHSPFNQKCPTKVMIIRNDQIAVMTVLPIASFLRRAVEFLYEHFPESLDGDSDQMSEAVGYLIEKADSYKLVTEQEVMTYITTAWLLGTDFDTEFPAARETLNSEDFSPEEKADWLAGWTEDIFATLHGEDR